MYIERAEKQSLSIREELLVRVINKSKQNFGHCKINMSVKLIFIKLFMCSIVFSLQSFTCNVKYFVRPPGPYLVNSRIWSEVPILFTV